MTKISIAMATYNGAAFLREQLASLLVQTIRPHELHVGDDGSTDDTIRIITDFAASAPFPVHIVCNPERLGFGENFIQTARRCTGDWIAFCDQDDVWNAEKLERCSAEIDRDQELVLIVHDAEVVDEQLIAIGPLYRYDRASTYEPLTLIPEWYRLGLTQVFKRSLLYEIPCRKRVSFPWAPHKEAHDVWISLVANLTGRTRIIPDKLLKYRRHAQAASNSPSDILAAFPTRRLQDGMGYSLRSQYLLDVAGLLESCRTDASPAVQRLIKIAINRLKFQAAMLAIRSEAYCGTNLFARIIALMRLIKEGGYIGGGGWPFGLLRLIKDIIYLPRR